MPDPSKMLTLIIPTRNRPHFLKRVLEYYKKTLWPYTLFIADASDPEYFEEIASWVRDSGKSLNITVLWNHCKSMCLSARKNQKLNNF